MCFIKKLIQMARQSLYSETAFQDGCTVTGVSATGSTAKFTAEGVLQFIEENMQVFSNQSLLGEEYVYLALLASDTQEDFNTAANTKLSEANASIVELQEDVIAINETLEVFGATNVLLDRSYEDFSLDNTNTQDDFNQAVYAGLQNIDLSSAALLDAVDNTFTGNASFGGVVDANSFQTGSSLFRSASGVSPLTMSLDVLETPFSNCSGNVVITIGSNIALFGHLYSGAVFLNGADSQSGAYTVGGFGGSEDILVYTVGGITVELNNPALSGMNVIITFLGNLIE